MIIIVTIISYYCLLAIVQVRVLGDLVLSLLSIKSHCLNIVVVYAHGTEWVSKLPWVTQWVVVLGYKPGGVAVPRRLSPCPLLIELCPEASPPILAASLAQTYPERNL